MKFSVEYPVFRNQKLRNIEFILGSIYSVIINHNETGKDELGEELIQKVAYFSSHARRVSVFFFNKVGKEFAKVKEILKLEEYLAPIKL